MLYYLFQYLQENYDLPGANLFNYITFRALMAAIVSLIVGIVFGKKIIYALQKKQIGETVRDLGLAGQMEKKGTPTMGGLIIIASILIPVLLFTNFINVYILLLLMTTVWMGSIGFLDDYIKVFKKNKEGLQGKFKVVGQVGLGLVVGLTLLYNQNVTVREFTADLKTTTVQEILDEKLYNDVKSLSTTIPFTKENELDYNKVFGVISDVLTPILYVLFVVFLVTAVSNGANITDGIDGLAAGTSAIIALVLGIFAYVSGNILLADYLNVMFIPNSAEIVIFCAALFGACIGFLWYNSFPAQVFMGDTGSLMLGGVIAVLSLSIRKELMIPVMCGIFLVENISVMLQVGYFKYTKKKYGEGKRIFLMAPLHHHYQKMQIPESKIVTRFWIVGVLLAIVTIATLKVR